MGPEVSNQQEQDGALTPLHGINKRPFHLSGAITLFDEVLRVSRICTDSAAPIVATFGSARSQPNHDHYKLAERTGAVLARSGFSTVTGAGPGVMEGANKGAFEAIKSGATPKGVESMGVKIYLPFERDLNPYLTQDTVTCQYFASRKLGLTKNSVALVCLPGGMGTADEMIEVIKVSNSYDPPIPVILVGDYWKPLMRFMETNPDGPVQRGYMDPRALRNVHYVDNEQDLPDLIQEKAARRIERYHGTREAALTEPKNEFDWTMAIKLDSAFENGSQKMLNAVLDGRLSRYPLACVASHQVTDLDGVEKTLHQIGKYANLQGVPLMVADSGGAMGSALDGFFSAIGNPLSTAFALDLRAEPEDLHGDKVVRVYPKYHMNQELMLTKFSAGAVVGPGGLGTISFAAEILDLQTTGKSADYRMALVGSRFWNAFFDSLREISYQSPGRNDGADGGHDYISWGKIEERTVITDDSAEALGFALDSDTARRRQARLDRFRAEQLA